MLKVARSLPCVLALLSCQAGRGTERAAERHDPTPGATSATPEGVAQEPVGPAPPTPLAGERVDIPGGAFKAGSLPGEIGRRPELEQRRTDVELGPFRIDRLPYPNDPTKPPLRGVTRDAAERLCLEQGTRLCTELEWERACKGPASQLYPSGDSWNDRCAADPKTCASGFDVLGMGALREWTSSDVAPGSEADRKAALRGAPPGAPGPEHRCAARTALDPTATAPDLGFRCCKGPRNAGLVQEPRAAATFTKITLPATKLAELFARHPKTAALAKNVRLYRDPDGAETVVSRGPGDRKGFLFTVSPLLWSPVPGAEFLVVSGRAGEDTAFVVAFHVLGTARDPSEGDYLLASSFVMEHEPGPVALAYSPSIKPRLHFSTCWGCPGETGKLLYRDPDSVVILQP